MKRGKQQNKSRRAVSSSPIVAEENRLTGKEEDKGKKLVSIGSCRPPCRKEITSHNTRRIGFRTKKGEHRMHFKKSSLLMGLILAIGLFGCGADKKAEAPKQEQITKEMVPPKAEVKGPVFFVELTDLKVLTTVSTATKEIVETPTLKGNIKITNKSKDNLDIQAVTLEYLDEAGKMIPYKTDEKIVRFIPSGRSFRLKAWPKVLWRSRSQ